MNSKNILGGILGSFEDDFERETSVVSTMAQTVSQGINGAFKDILGLGQDIVGTESKSKSNETTKFSTTGSIEFKKIQAQNEQLQKEQDEKKEEIERKKIFFQALKEDQERAEKEKGKLLFEEEINDIVTNLPTEQKNQLLHYQASYRDRSIYQRAELRKKLIEQQKKSEKQEKTASIPTPAKQPSAMEGAFEGRSGSQGSGSANLSNQAVG